jgi:hypothetical protein
LLELHLLEGELVGGEVLVDVQWDADLQIRRACGEAMVSAPSAASV